MNDSSCKALWDSGTPAKPLPDKQWTLRDSMLRDGKFKSASKFSMAARGEKPFSWVGALTESDEAVAYPYPPCDLESRVYMASASILQGRGSRGRVRISRHRMNRPEFASPLASTTRSGMKGREHVKVIYRWV